MTSRYDSKKKCRVGTMDQKQFYAESDGKAGPTSETFSKRGRRLVERSDGEPAA